MIQLKYNGECVSLPVPGALVTCSNKCGNATCESWEDTCNCPQDCKASCIKAGEVYQSPAVLGKEAGECCEGLAVIVQATSSDCAQAAVAGGENSICSACGNGSCESWENKCNCPQDCKTNCHKAGEIYSLMPLPNGEQNNMDCCVGLKPISKIGLADVAVCSHCGNDICDSFDYGLKEDSVNCPQDCKKLPKTVSVPKDDKELRSCTSSSDCQFVEPKTCCGCYEIINKKYTNYWSSSAQQDCNALDIACQMCRYYENDLNAVCIDNTCQGVPK